MPSAFPLLTWSQFAPRPLQMTFAHREHTPESMTKTILGNFVKVHLDRADAADDATRDMFQTTIHNLYVSF